MGNVKIRLLKRLKKDYKMVGAVLWFTGLSGSGKSTAAERVFALLTKDKIPVELLDGDEIRENLTRDLGFTKEDRDENIRRIGFIASLLAKHDVIAITACISPYQKMRDHVRSISYNFIEIHVAAPLEVCEKRDVKGLYKKARRGEIPIFTGISDPYESPKNPEIILETHKESIEESAQKVITYLKEKKII
jgi:adenylylsulfate kinase